VYKSTAPPEVAAVNDTVAAPSLYARPVPTSVAETPVGVPGFAKETYWFKILLCCSTSIGVSNSRIFVILSCPPFST
jgi:hypothetical protein